MLLALATEVSAQATYTSNASGNWNDPGSWTIGGTADGNGDGIPDGDDDVIITSAHVITVDVLSDAFSITINAGATLDLNGFTFVSAVPFTLDGASLTNGSVTGVTCSGTITLAGAGNIIANSGTIDVTGNINTGGFVLTLDGTADGEVSGVISGTGAVTKTGTGAWTLSGANTFNGATTLSAGTLNIDHATAIGSGTLIINGGTVDNTSGGTIILSNNNPQTWNADFTFAGTNALNLGTGTVTMGADRQVTVSANTLTVGGTLSAPGADLIKAGNGTLSFDDNAVTLDGLTINAGTLTAPSSVGSLTLASDLTNNDTFDHNDGTVTFNGAAQTIGGGAATILSNVTTTGTTNTSTGVATTIAGNLSVGAGTTFTAAGFNLTVTGTTTVAGSLTISSAVGVKTFTGLVTIDAGANWNNSANSDVTFGGGITNNNIFNAGSGINTFNNTRSLTGSFSIPRVVVSGVLGNTNILTVGTSLSGSGTLIQEPNATLNIGGTSASLAALDATASGNTVNYTGASQSVFATPYENLGINQSSGQAVLDGDLTVNDQLTMTSGHLNLGGYVLTLGPSAVVAGAGASRFIIASGSEVRKEFTSGGAFTFPIGDNTGVTEYSPVAVTVAGTAFGANAYVAASVVDAKHSSNASTANFLTRYWTIEQSAITGCQVDVTGTYLNTDVSGVEASLGAAKLEGTFNQTANPWVKTGFVVDAANHELEYTGVALTAGLTSAFTGIRGASPTVVIDQGATAKLCPGGSLSLTTTVTGGDPTIIYSWTPTAGLSATTVSNPTVIPTVDNIYTVTIRDGNGITATANINVTINPAPAITTHPVSITQCADGGVTFTVVATGTTLSYQWRRNGGNLSNGGVYSGVNTSTLSISTVAGLGGNFDVVVTETSATPSCPVTSNAATLTVNPLPTGLAVTTAASAICYGTSTNIQIASSQSGVTYQLRNDVGDVAIGSPVAGTGGLINLPTGNLTANTTFNVFATVTATGCDTEMNNTIAVAVNALPTITTHPVSITQCADGGVTFTVVATGTTLSYQWRRNGGNLSNGGVYSGVNTSTLSISTVAGLGGNFDVIVTETSATPSCPVTSNAATLTVNPLPTGLAVTTAASAICYGTSTNIQIASSQSGVTYQLRNDAGDVAIGSPVAGTGGLINLPTGNLTASTTFNVFATLTATGCDTEMNNTVAVTVNALPSITTHPVSITQCADGGVTFTVVATGTTLSYQWRRNGGNLSNGGVYSGVNTSTLSISTVAGLGGNFDVIVTETSATPSCPVTSNAATLTVNPLPTGLAVTTAASAICYGTSTNIQIASSQSGVTYQLRNDAGDVAIGSPVAGTGGLINLPTGNLTASTTFNVFATLTATGCDTEMNNTVAVTVNALPSITTHPVSITQCADGGVTFTVAATGTTLSYQWRRNGGNLSNGGVYSGVNTSTLSISTVAGLGGNFDVIVTETSATPSCPVTSNTATLTVNPLPTGLAVTTAASAICYGTSTNIQIASSQSGVTYQLRNDAGDVAIGSPVAGTGGLINLPTGNLTANTTFNVFATVTATGCDTEMNNTVAVAVNALPSITTHPVSITQCADGGVTFTVAATGTTLSYQWRRNGGNLSNGGVYSGVNTSTLSISNVAGLGGNFDVIVTETSATPSCPVTSNAATLTVNPLPTGLAVTTAASAICYGTSTNIQIASSQSGVTYQLRNDAGDVAIGSPVAGTGGLINLPTGNLTASTTFNVFATLTATGCDTEMNNTVAVTVNALPSITTHPVSITQCADGGVTFTVAATGTTLSYQWRRNGGNLSNGGVYSGVNTSTLSISNVAGLGGNFDVIVTETSATPNCPVTSNAATLTVNPLPTGLAVTTAASAICYGTSTNIQIASSQSGVTYQLRNDAGDVAIGSPVAGTGGLINLPTGNLTASTTFNVLAITTATGCDTEMNNTVTVTVNAQLSVNAVSSDYILCEDETATLTATGSGGTVVGGYTYSWSPATGLSATNVANPTFTPPNITTQTIYPFTVTVTDNFGVVCTAQATVNITVDPVPTGLALTAAAPNICYGTSTNIQIAGSQSGVTYQLRNDAGDVAIGSPVAGTGGLINLPTGNLTASTTFNVLAITTATGCDTEMNNTVTVTVNAQLSVNAVSSDYILCEDETATLTATGSGGTVVGGYTYSWSPATGLSATNVASPTFTPPNITTQTLYPFTVTVTDNFGVVCTAQATVNITVDPVPTGLALTAAAPNICYGTSTNIQIAGSQSGVTYQLRNDAGDVAIGSPVAGTGGLINLPTGNLTASTTFNVLAITTATGCDTEMNNTVTVTVNAQLSVNAVSSDYILCEDETATLTATGSGGTVVGGYTYSWSPATGLSATNVANPTFTPPNITTQTIYPFTVTVTDNFGVVCTAQATVNITVDPVPTGLALTAAAPNICYGTSTNIQIAGSQNGVTYQLRNDAGDVAIGSPVAGTGGLINLPTGNLTASTTFNVLAITTATGCDTEMNNTVTVTVNAQLSVNAVSSDYILCEDETATLTATGSGGTVVGGYTYSWSPATGLSATNVANPTFTPPNITTQTIYPFTVTVTDNFGVVCTAQATVNITVDPVPTGLALTAAAPNICYGTSTNIQIASSQSGVTYQLRNDAGDVAIGSPVAGTGGLINLPTGNLTASTTFNVLAITTATGCDTEMNNTVTVTVNAQLSVNAVSSDYILCEDETATLTATGSGGTVVGGYTYSWSPATGLSATNVANPTFTPPNITTQTIYPFTVTVTDNFGVVCTAQATVNITVDPVPTGLALTAAAPNICYGTSTNIQIAGSQSGVTYQLRNDAGDVAIGSPVAGTGGLINLPTGNLTASTTFNVLAITTATGCDTEMNNTVTVTVNAQLSVNAVSSDYILCEDETATLTATGSGGTVVGGYTYSWAPATGLSATNVANPTFTPPNITTQTLYPFTVTVTDNFGVVCTAQATVNITVDPVPTGLALTAAAPNICYGTSTNIQIASSQSGVTYQLRNDAGDVAIGSPVAGTGGLINLPTGNLTASTTFNVLAITTATGCDTEMNNTVTVTVNAQLSVNAVSSDYILCENETATLTATGSGGTVVGGYTYSWSPATGLSATNVANPTFTPPNITTQTLYPFTVTVTDNFGVVCTAQAPVSITVDPTPELTVTDNIVGNTICSNGQTDITVTDPIAGSVITLVGVTISGASGNITGYSAVGSTFANGSRITDALVNTTTSPQTIKYDFRATANGCSGAVQSVTITVRPNAVFSVNNVASTICEGPGSATNIALNSSTSGIRVRIANVTATGSVTGFSAIGTQYTGFPATITDVLDNPTNTVQTVTYYFESSIGGICVNPVQQTAVVTVEPRPIGTPLAFTVCSDTPLGTVATLTTSGTSVSAASYTINTITPALSSSAGSPATGASKPADELINDAWTNTTGADVLVTYNITPVSSAGCSGAPFTVVVTVQSEPVTMADDLAGAVCSDNAVGYTLSVSGASSFTISTNSNGLVQSAGTVSAGSGKVAAELSDDQWTNTTLADVNVEYTIIPFSGSCAGNSFKVTVPIKPEPRGVNAVKEICSSSSVNYDLQANVNGAGGNSMASDFTWVAADNTNVTGESTSSQSGSTITDVLVNTTSVNQVVVYTVTPTGTTSACTGNSFIVTVTVKPEPVGVPLAFTVCSDTPLGTVATLITNGSSVSAASYTINSITPTLSSSAGSPAAGASKPADELINDAWTNTTGADVLVTYNIMPVSSAGCAGAPFTVVVTVQSEPVTMTDDLAGSVCSDNAVGYTLSVSGASSYTISTNSNGLVQSAGTVSAGSGKVAAELSDDQWTNTTLADVNVEYTIIPFSGSCAGNSFNVTVPIKPEPRGVNAVKEICSSSSVNYDLQANVNGAGGNSMASDFTWVAADNTNVTGESTSSQSGSTITDVLVNTTSVNQVVVYTVTPMGPTGSPSGCVGNSFTVTVTVRPEPVGVPLAFTICSDTPLGTAATLATNGSSVSAASYTINTITPTLTSSAGSPVPGASKPADELINDAWTNAWTSTSSADALVTYNISPVSSAGCSGAPFTVSVTVQLEPETVTDASAGAVCSDNAVGYPLSVSGTSSYTISTNSNGLMQSLGTVSAGSGKGVAELSDDQWTNTTLADVNVEYTIIPFSGSCAGNSFKVTVPIKPEPRGVNAVKEICSSTSVNYDLQANVNGAGGNTMASGFTWAGASNTNVTGESTTNQSGSTINDVLVNTTSVDQVVVYTVTPKGTASGCAGNSFTVTVTVKPEPVGATKDLAVCSDVAANYNLINNIAIFGNNVGSTFSWFAANNTSVGGESQSPQMSGSITDVLNNVTASQQSVVYNVTPTSVAGCVGTTFNITIKVNPEPVGVNTSVVICSGSSVAYDLQANINSVNIIPTNFSWSAAANNNVDGESTFVKNADVIDDNLININSTNNSENVLYTITPVDEVKACVGDAFTLNVTVNPRAKVSAGPDLAQCRDQSSIKLQGTIGYAPNGITWSGGAGTYSSTSDINAFYTFKDTSPSEVNTTITLQVTALDPDGAGPCPLETDNMTLRINPLPVVFFSGFSTVTSPPEVAENDKPVLLTANEEGGTFTILPPKSNIGSTIVDPVARVFFDPSAVELGRNFVTYTFTDANGCTNSTTQEVQVNPITDVDFTIQGATLSGDGVYELCSELGRVRLIGFPAASTGQGPETQFTSPSPAVTIVQEGNEYYIQTDGLASGTYAIRYDYKNQFGALTFKNRSVRIFASPVAQFNSTNNCIDSDVVFTDDSKIRPTPFPTSLDAWQWNFGDNTSSTSQNPTKRYAASNTYYATLKVTTLQGCSNTSGPLANPIRVGDVPLPDFEWSAICNHDFTKFEDLSNPGTISTITGYQWDFGDGDILTGTIGGTVPGGWHGGKTTGTYDKPDHKYSAFGTYDTKLTVTTNDGCSNSIVKKVFILPYSTVRPLTNAAYYEAFETTDGGWIAEAFDATNSTRNNVIKSDTSWIWGIPAGVNINATNSGGAWWTGKNFGAESSYYVNENSVVNGPCFDLSALQRPMVSLDYFSDADLSDGAVLQYSIDGGNNWRIVGPNEALQDRDQGINWYNGSSIPSNPGEQFLGQYGWTGTGLNTDGLQGKWKNGRFNLDMIPVANRGQVRLRIAFASNDGNPTTGPYDGFAFDNVFVGDKKRTVMVEHFTNDNYLPARIASQDVDQLYDNQATIRMKPDFFKIEYHMNVPSADQLNQENPTDPGARAFYYQNITQPPFTIMDGILGKFYNKTFQGGHKIINEIEIDRRALEDPAFSIDTILIDQTAPSNIIRATVDFTYVDSLTSLSNPVVFQAALIETDVYGSRNVVRKLLLNSEGFTVNRAWRYQDTQQIDINYTMDVPVADPSKLYLVVFVQDFKTQKIHQASIVKAPSKTGVPPVGLPDDPLAGEIANIAVYPNPASQHVNFYLENTLTKDYAWEIIDQRGIKVLSGALSHDLSTPQQVEIKDLANGIYFVRFTHADKTLVYRKVAVMNRH